LIPYLAFCQSVFSHSDVVGVSHEI